MNSANPLCGVPVIKPHNICAMLISEIARCDQRNSERRDTAGAVINAGRFTLSPVENGPPSASGRFVLHPPAERESMTNAKIITT